MRRLSVPLACLLLAAGCGYFADADSATSSEDRRTDERAVEDVAAPQTTAPTTTTVAPAPSTTTAAASPPVGNGAPAPVVTTPPQAPGPANVASGVVDGLRIDVVAEDGPAYPSRPRFRIQVIMLNVSAEGRYHLVGQGDYAVIRDRAGADVWWSNTCNPTMDVYEQSAGAQEIHPGEDVSVIVPYPQPEMAQDRGCDLPDGTYTLHGIFPMCPREHVRETANPGTYVCEEGRAVEHESPGLQITIG